MRALWLCSSPLSDGGAVGTGTWLGAMARGLLETKRVELGIIAFGGVRRFTRRDYQQVKQWLVPSRYVAPSTSFGRVGLPGAELVRAIVGAAEEFRPDIVHVWGTEAFWGLLPARGLLPYPSLLEIQGLKGQISKSFMGGLTLQEQLGCIGIKEVLKRRTLQCHRRDFARWGACEEEMIRGHTFVDVQSSWAAAQVAAINPSASVHTIGLSLRRPFYSAAPWEPPSQPSLFCTASHAVPYKGLHVAIRAFALVRHRIPNSRLRIAGAHQLAGVRQSGYMRWVNRLVQELGLRDAIDWIGPINAEQVVAELKRAAAIVIPSFIENACTAMQEAMAVGTPVVASYAGGIPSLGKDEESCLFFPPGDEHMCANQLTRVLLDHGLAKNLSRESRQVAAQRGNQEGIAEVQLNIYQRVLMSSKNAESKDV